MTRRAARVGERLARHRDELPGIAVVVQPQLQHAEGAAVAGLTQRENVGLRPAAVPTRPGDELAHPVHRIGRAVRLHRREPLVEVAVPVHDDIGVRRVQIVDERPRARERRPAGAAPTGRGVERMVVVGERALVRVGGEIGLQPCVLRRPAGGGDVAVQHHHVPRAQLVAVVALAGFARGRAEVGEVPGGARGVVVVIARRRPGARLVAAPGRRVAAGELGAGPVGHHVVAQGEHRPGNRVQQLRGRLIVVVAALRDVARPGDELRWVGRHESRGGRVQRGRCGLHETGVVAAGADRESGEGDGG